MREIKFRGKRKDNEEWVYGYLFKIWDECYILWGTTNGVPNMVEVIPKTIGQYTGLKDKNGKEIYEGDIIQYEDIKKGVVEYSEKYAQFILKETGIIVDECEALGEFNIKVFEVLGNIYNNPELLEEKR